ncbi:MAG: TA system VapC family ribonuclease toxin [Acidobacteriota bacterium]
MKIAVDSNILVYAHVARFAEHERARGWIQQQLEQPDVTLVTTPLILSEVVHVITDPRRFTPPVPMREALELARNWLGRSNVECLSVDDEATALAFDLMDRHGLGRSRLADTLLAGTLLVHQVTVLATHNVIDFSVFGELRLIDPVA